MTKWTCVVGVLLAGAGCTKPNPALSCEDGLCSDPTVPYCDVSGAISGEPNTCIHVSCTANEFVECRGDKALTCNANGDNYDLVSCAYGCDENGCKPPPPCDTLECQKHIIPKYIPSECNTLAMTDLMISSNTSIDTSEAATCTSIVTQPGAPELCVMHYSTITVEANQTLAVTGTRALALVADRNLVVSGIVDVSATDNIDGPGGGGALVSGTTSNNTKPGGGAGYRHVGGAGASTSLDGGAANGGAAATNPLQLATLAGGARSDTSTSAGGGGGGALTLVSCRDLSISGLIDAGGGGGAGGQLPVQGTYRYARGGGAGGTVVLQGMSVSMVGEIYANGGGGGGGGSPGGRGQKGQRSTVPAPGGLLGMFNSTTISGGYGGTANAPGPGKADEGAGGGAAGYILVYVPTGSSPTVTPAGISPPIEPTASIATN